jgi:hypothetical protein
MGQQRHQQQMSPTEAPMDGGGDGYFYMTHSVWTVMQRLTTYKNIIETTTIKNAVTSSSFTRF